MTAESADKLEQAATPKPRWRDPAWLLRCLLTYALALLGGFVASLLSVPLPWMLGPFFLCGALSAFGLKLAFLPMGRAFGQLAVDRKRTRLNSSHYCASRLPSFA